MNNDFSILVNLYGLFVILVFICGLYCIMLTKNLIRILIGIEILAKAVTLMVIVAGYVSNHMAVAQTFVITVIIIEVVLVPVVAGLILGIFQKTDTLDVQKIRNLQG